MLAFRKVDAYRRTDICLAGRDVQTFVPRVGDRGHLSVVSGCPFAPASGCRHLQGIGGQMGSSRKGRRAKGIVVFSVKKPSAQSPGFRSGGTGQKATTTLAEPCKQVECIGPSTRIGQYGTVGLRRLLLPELFSQVQARTCSQGWLLHRGPRRSRRARLFLMQVEQKQRYHGCRMDDSPVPMSRLGASHERP
jgi:hypothetical protein